MKEIILDFSDIPSVRGLHEYLKGAFGLPDCYGYNMDALWDCLHHSFPAPTVIVLTHLDRLPAGMENTARTLARLFRDLEREDSWVTVRFEGEEPPAPSV